MPTTRSGGKPVTSFMAYTMASSGFDTTMTKASGQRVRQVLGHAADDLQVDAEQIVARHARLARHARR